MKFVRILPALSVIPGAFIVRWIGRTPARLRHRRKTTKPARQEHDFAFRRYLERKHSLTISANSTDYRPTSQGELDKLAEEAIRDFERACILLDAMTAEERAECKTVYALLHPRIQGYNHDDLVSFFLENQDPGYKSAYGDMKKFVDYVGPRWLEAYIAYGALRTLFKPEARKLPMVTGRDPGAKRAA